MMMALKEGAVTVILHAGAGVPSDELRRAKHKVQRGCWGVHGGGVGRHPHGCHLDESLHTHDQKVL